MKEGPSWEALVLIYSEIHHMLQNLKIHYHIDNLSLA